MRQEGASELTSADQENLDRRGHGEFWCKAAIESENLDV